MAGGRPPPHPASQLVQLGQPEPLGVLDQHHRRVGDVDPDFDHRRRDEHLDLVVAEGAHDRVALVPFHFSVHQPDGELGVHFPEGASHRGRRA